MQDLEILKEEIIACDYCSLRCNNLEEQPLPFRGNGNILFVTPPPSTECLLIERHFNVTEQRYFDLVLKAANIETNNITISSITKCHIEKINKENISNKDLCATKFLLREIWEIKPKVIVPIGKLPTAHFLKLSMSKLKMSHVINETYEYESIPVIPIPTMAHLIQRGRKETDKVIKQLNKINNIKG